MKRYNITVNGKAYDVAVEEVGGNAPVASAPIAAPIATPAPTAPVASAPITGGTDIASPMPGTILDIKVAIGDTVKSGQPVVVLEAMKMENDINSPCDGKVVSITVEKGAAVETGTVIAVIQ